MSSVENNPEEAEATVTEANGATAPSPSPAVVKLGSDDALTVQAAQRVMADAQKELGMLREQYLAEEMARIQEIAKARQSFEGVLRTLAEKHGVDLISEKWTLNLADMTFRQRG